MTNVSIITPCRNEETFIGKCLDSIIANVFPKEKMEILVIDGRSTDRTRGIAEGYAKEHSFIKLMDNPGIIQTLATNIGIRASKGDVIIRMDAHVEYPKDFVSKSVRYLENSGADGVGGIVITKPGDNTPMAEAIALSLSHPFGVGNAHYRIGIKEPKYVDTVPYGCYKREVFNKVGLFNGNLNRTDDIEFNLRLKRAGGKILLVPEIFSYYYARSNLADLVKQNFGNGFWVLYSLRFVKLPFSLRHLVPFFFVSSLLGSFLISFTYQPFIYLLASILGLYFCLNLLVSCKLSLKHGIKYFPFLIITFLTLHISYGLGSLWGMFRLFLHKILHSFSPQSHFLAFLGK
jgi:glycosyltransferase involved in cell wall biosynthesis